MQKSIYPFTTIFGPQAAHFQGISGFSMVQNGSPLVQNGQKTLLWASQMVHHNFWKTRL